MLVKCKKCRKEIDSNTPVCPYCQTKSPAAKPKSGCLIFLFAVLTAGLWFLNEERPYYVDRDKANYRAEPKGDILGYMKRGTPVRCLKVENGWCETKKDARTVYFPMKVLTKKNPAKAPDLTTLPALSKQPEKSEKSTGNQAKNK